MELKKEIALNIRKRREDMKLTQGQVAEMLGTTRQNYGHMEMGKTNLNIGTLEKLANTLKIDIVELLKTNKNG